MNEMVQKLRSGAVSKNLDVLKNKMGGGGNYSQNHTCNYISNIILYKIRGPTLTEIILV